MKWGRPTTLKISYVLMALSLLAIEAAAGLKWGLMGLKWG